MWNGFLGYIRYTIISVGTGGLRSPPQLFFKARCNSQVGSIREGTAPHIFSQQPSFFKICIRYALVPQPPKKNSICFRRHWPLNQWGLIILHRWNQSNVENLTCIQNVDINKDSEIAYFFLCQKSIIELQQFYRRDATPPPFFKSTTENIYCNMLPKTFVKQQQQQRYLQR